MRPAIALLLALCATAHAQTAPIPPQFQITTLDNRIRNAYYLHGGSQAKSLRLLPGFVAGPYLLNSSRKLSIYQRSASGQPLLLATTSVPTSISEPLLIVQQSLPEQNHQPEGDQLPYSITVLDNSAKAAPLDNVRFLNTSDYPAAVSFAHSAVKTVAPGSQLAFPFNPPTPGDSYRSLHVALQSPDGQWHRLSSSKENEIYLEKDTRILVIIRNPPAMTETHNDAASAIVVIQDSTVPRPITP